MTHRRGRVGRIGKGWEPSLGEGTEGTHLSVTHRDGMGWIVEQGKAWRALKQKMDHSGDKEEKKCPSHIPLVGESKVSRKDEQPG